MSSGCVDSAKSDAIGKLRRSGRWHLVLIWHTAPSKTRRGSLPSAKTTFSLLQQCLRAIFPERRWFSTIQLLAISLRSSLAVSGVFGHLPVALKFPDPEAARSLASLLHCVLQKEGRAPARRPPQVVKGASSRIVGRAQISTRCPGDDLPPSRLEDSANRLCAAKQLSSLGVFNNYQRTKRTQGARLKQFHARTNFFHRRDRKG